MHWEWGIQRGHPGRSCAWTPEKAGYIYWHSKHLCFCKGYKRESASLPGGMIYGLPRHWVWAALEGMMQCLMDEGWGYLLGHTLIKRIKLPWLVEWDANAIPHVDIKGRECLEGANLLYIFTLIPLVQIRASVLLPRPYVSEDWGGVGGAHPILQPPMIPHLPLAILNWECGRVF